MKQLEVQLSSPKFLRQLDVNTVKLWPEDRIQRKHAVLPVHYFLKAAAQMQGHLSIARFSLGLQDLRWIWLCSTPVVGMQLQQHDAAVTVVKMLFCRI